ncbi:MAG: hypothetical protein AB7S74_02170 [Hyphomicrobium sp.]
MASSPASATDTHHTDSSHLTIGWLAKRSALWLFIMAVGIGAACCLYAYADEPARASDTHVTASKN